jgi:2-keto-4-pentenoate hydratase
MTTGQLVDALWPFVQAGTGLPSEWKGKLSQGQAYEVQLGALARRVAAGDRHVGWKVGLTSKGTQTQFGLFEPILGHLLRSGARPSGAEFGFAQLVRPGFENELCLTLGQSLPGPGVTLEQARAAIVAVAPALEIVELRTDLSADLNLAIADNALQTAFVTGTPQPLAPGVDLAEAVVDVFVNGRHMEQARGAEVLGNPAASVAWLANKLAELGRRLEAGMLIMSGSLTRFYPANKGDHVEARFTPFGAVSARFP